MDFRAVMRDWPPEDLEQMIAICNEVLAEKRK